nr:unnamed protein product [Digitaria exilis]
MAAAQEEQAIAAAAAAGGRWGQRWGEDWHVSAGEEVAEEGRCPVVLLVAAEEAGVGDEAAPALADEGDPGKGGRLRRHAEEDLAEEVVVVREGYRRRSRPS